VSRVSIRLFCVMALAVALGLAAAVSPYASSAPDGLERVARDEAFLDERRKHSLQDDSPVPGYAFPGIENRRVATGVAGCAGSLGVFAVGWVLALAIRRRRAAANRGRAWAPARSS
jgi:hypothetical protein